MGSNNYFWGRGVGSGVCLEQVLALTVYIRPQDSCRVCHAVYLPAPVLQLSPVVKIFGHLGHFSPTLSTTATATTPPSFPLRREHIVHSLRGQRGMDREKEGAEEKAEGSDTPLPPLPQLLCISW